MKLEEEVVEPVLSVRSTGKAKEKKAKRHNHIGPNRRAFSAGLAFCPVCDSDKIVRMTEQERAADWAAREAEKAKRGR